MSKADQRVKGLGPMVVALLVSLLASTLLVACTSSSDEQTLFTALPADSTGISFANPVTPRPELHLLNYEYFYNGGGVAVGDLNGDKRPDIYFTANQGPNALYLNQGNFRFADITDATGMRAEGWATGVTMADVNGDGRLDIYVCYSGLDAPDQRRNKLYINQGADADGTPRFTEQAAAYGVDDPAHSTHATFFDYDRDGDLDLYLLNHPIQRSFQRSVSYTSQSERRRMTGDKLYRNDGNTFTEVSQESRIADSPPGFGLSATVSDLNRDGWPDVYVANDFAAPDRVYINQGDGTFADKASSWLDHMSASSMGADIADINNDGRLDIYTLDMLAEDNYRQKILRATPGPSNQFMRNMLHLGRADTAYSEIGQFAGVSNTDWSWAALFADFDLDGYHDLYVTNGFARDYTNLDFLYDTYVPALEAMKGDREQGAAPMFEVAQQMPSTPIPNYAFRNEGDPGSSPGQALTFDDVSAAWGLGTRGFSNGAAYGDLDGDGDLDLVTSNINAPASIYRNEVISRTTAQRADRRYLRVRLAGAGGNRHGIGAQVTVRVPGGETHYRELQPARGFQSSVEPVLTVGLGAADAKAPKTVGLGAADAKAPKTVDVTVRWPDGRTQTRRGVAANQTITLRQADASAADASAADASAADASAADASPADGRAEPTRQPLLVDQTRTRGLTFTHQENRFNDFSYEPLLPRMLSRLGPALAVGDANGDGREDVFVGGARGQRGALFLQQPGGAFARTTVSVLSAHRGYEDVAATFFDANGDGALDLYVVSGGNSEVNPAAYQDRLYLNAGSGGFQAAVPQALPAITSSGGAVAPHDMDGDGDTDLFVGGRVVPGAYPEAPRSYLLENDGTGRFTDVTASASEGLPGGGLERPGMVTAAVWADLTGDGAKELVLAGEWMPVRAFARRADGTFEEVSGAVGLSGTSGWWEALLATDIDGDGDVDVVGGNWGENAQVEARAGAPVRVYAADADGDGQVDPLMSHVLDGTEYPIPMRDALVNQIPSLALRFPDYTSYAKATMGDVLEALGTTSDVQRLDARTFASTAYINEDGQMQRQALPAMAQIAPTRAWARFDVDGDGRPELLAAGNDYTMQMPWGRQDAGKGTVLRRADGNGRAEWTALPVDETGVWAAGDVRHIATVETPSGPIIVVASNDGPLRVWGKRPERTASPRASRTP